jgi:hypothetical protein
MKFNIKLNEYSPDCPVRVGNIYHVKGGNGMRDKHMMALIAVTKDSTCLLMVLDREGKPVGVTQYGMHNIEDRMPIGFCAGLSELEFDILPL